MSIRSFIINVKTASLWISPFSVNPNWQGSLDISPLSSCTERNKTGLPFAPVSSNMASFEIPTLSLPFKWEHLPTGGCAIAMFDYQRVTLFDSQSSPFTSFKSVIPSGKRLHNYGKSPCFMGKSTINGDFP